MPPAATGSFSNHLAPGLMAIIGTNLKGRETFYSRYYNMRTSQRNYEDVLAATGLPIAPAKGEADDIVSVDPLEGSTKRISFNEWGIGVEITQTAWEDDLYAGDGSALRDAAGGIADSLAERVEVEAHRPFNAIATTTYTVLPDNSALFATSHAPIAGGEAAAQSNREDVDLSVSSFRDALVRMRKYTNDRGIRIPSFADPRTLIIPPDLEYVAGEILRSPMRPDTGNQVTNVTQGRVQVSVTPYMTDTDSWVLQSSKHFMDFFWRSRPRFDNFDDRRSRVAVFLGWERFKEQPLHWIGMHGSAGA